MSIHPSSARAHALKEELILYVSGKQDRSSDAINRHLPGCPECQALLVELVGPRPTFAEAKLAEEPRPALDDRRREHRIEVYDAAEIRALNPFSPRIIEAMVVDTSPSGAQLRMPLPMPIGAILQIRISGKSSTLIGEIRHCTPRDGAHYVGVEIRTVFPAS